MQATGYKEAARRKRMGSDWMKHGKDIFDPGTDAAAGMSHFGHLSAACTAFGNYPGIWFFCGGTALDLFVGRPIRTRHDIDIGILRDEQDELPKHFPGIKIVFVPEGGGRKLPWQGDRLTLPIHELYLELPGEHLEVLLNEADETHWIYRRDARIKRDLSKAVLNNAQGVPYLAPEIVLLYKSKHMRERDIIDFDSTKPALDAEQKAWLKAALDDCYLGAHPWSQSLA